MTGRARRILLYALGAVGLVVFLALAAGPAVVGRMMNPTLPLDAPPVSAEAARIHATLTGADLHADALLWDRDLLVRGRWGHVDIPRLIEGHIALEAFTVVTKAPRNLNIESNTGDSDQITLLALLEAWPPRTWGSLTERAIYQADKLRRFAADSRGRLAIIRTREDLRGFLRSREADEETVAGILGIEGAHALEGDLDNVVRLYEAGFRIFGLTHFFDNEVGGSAHGVGKGGLTDFGARVLGRLEDLGITVDLAHASPALVDDVLARATRPVIVSHTGVKGTCANKRNLDDRRLAAVAATGGVVGIGLWETAVCGRTPADWARAIRHAVDVAGVDHVALGSDWDGVVEAILDASGTVHLVQALLDQGFSEQDIRKLMGENVVRVLLETLPSQGRAR